MLIVGVVLAVWKVGAIGRRRRRSVPAATADDELGVTNEPVDV